MTVLKTQGVVMAVGAVGGPYTAVGQVTAISNVGEGAPSEIDVTDLDSTSKEFLLGLKESQEITVTLNYDPDDTQHNLLRGAVSSGTQQGVTITLTDGTPSVSTVNCYITALNYDVGVDDKLVANVTLKYMSKDYSFA